METNLNISWWGTNGNWGDALNKPLCELISGRSTNKIETRDETSIFRYYCIGSVLEHPRSGNFEVWGSGLMFSGSRIPIKPNNIHAVRGPLTRELIIKQGLKCPQIYGDPALLYSRYYFPEINKKYKLGIIPHYVDRNHEIVKSLSENPDIKILNICDDTNMFIDNLLECEYIISSSLHGIIASDSYGIPSMWVEFSDKVLGKGFKFNDYFTSVNRKDRNPLIFKEGVRLDEILDSFYDYKIEIDLDVLYNSCPFKK